MTSLPSTATVVATLIVSLAWKTILATSLFANTTSTQFSVAAFEPVPYGGRSRPQQHYGHRNWHRHGRLPETSRHRSFFRVRLSAAASVNIGSEEVRRRNIEQLDKLRTRDRSSRKILPGELKIIFEDEHIVCVDKPAGVLCVPSVEGIPTLAQTVFETVPHNQGSLDRMVVHRLGMDTSGLVVFAKTMESLRGMNTLFRTRKITRQYEVLVCGHLSNDKGTIDLPLMRDYERPPFMRVSTDEHQRVLMDLDAAIVGKKLLEAPKASQTEYEVIARETFLDTDLPVTRLLLTSVTGRTHQLNVHMAAIGHPIVGDRVYGVDGDAVPNGGLELWQADNIGGGNVEHELEGANNTTIIASQELERAIGARATNMCVHAKCLSFRHPMMPPDDDPLYFECEAHF